MTFVASICILVVLYAPKVASSFICLLGYPLFDGCTLIKWISDAYVIMWQLLSVLLRKLMLTSCAKGVYNAFVQVQFKFRIYLDPFLFPEFFLFVFFWTWIPFVGQFHRSFCCSLSFLLLRSDFIGWKFNTQMDRRFGSVFGNLNVSLKCYCCN